MSLGQVEITQTQMPFGQIESQVSSFGVFSKHSFEQIADTEVDSCHISFSGFENVFNFEIVDVIWGTDSEQIILKLEYSDNFFVTLILKGYWEGKSESFFYLNDVDWNFEKKESNPESVFVLNTFFAIVCLSDKVKVEIPSIDYYFTLSVPSTLNSVSEILQKRQLAHRLMVIEKAFGLSLPFPKRFITGEEVETIAFCYHAIVKREFEWSYDFFALFLNADKENLRYLPSENTSYHLLSPILNEIKIIFDQRISLGQFMVEIEKAVIENYEEVKANFDELNGQTVKILIRPLDGKIKYKTLNAPVLPKKAWKNDIQKLIGLDEKFNSVFLDKYFKLAASTLEGLSEEQKEAITERPKLSLNFE